MLLVAMPGHMLCNVWYVCDEGCAWKYCPQLKSVQQLLSAAEALHCAWLQEDAWVEEDTEDDAEADEASDGHIISARAKERRRQQTGIERPAPRTRILQSRLSIN